MGLLSNCDQRADVVEQIDEQEHEDDFDQAIAQRSANIQVQSRRRDVLKRIRLGLPVHQAEDGTERGGSNDAQQNRARNTPGHERSDQEQPRERQHRFRISQIAHGDEGRRTGDNDSGVAQTNQRNEEPDADRDRGVELERNRRNNHAPDAHRGEKQERDSRQKDRAQRRLPWHVHPFDDGVRKIRIQSHAGRQRDGVAREHAHQNAAERGAQTGGSDHSGQRHSGLMQDGRIHEDDVRHGDEGRRSGEDLGPPIGAEFAKFEVPLKAFFHGITNSNAPIRV